MGDLRTFLVEFCAEDDCTYWNIDITSEEYDFLTVEVEAYNIWIETYLNTGRAPKCSYEKIEDANILFLLYGDPSYQTLFERPTQSWAYGFGPYKFRLIDIAKPVGTQDNKIIDDFATGELNMGDSSELIEIITEPFSTTGFGMGYRVLPFTQMLINTNRL